MNNSLPIVPFLEEVSSVFLMSWMDFRCKDHKLSEFTLLESFIDKKIVFLMHSSMTSLARPLENFESSPQSNKRITSAKKRT